MNKRTAPALLGVIALGFFLSACASFETNSGKAVIATATTVEAARKAWVDYVTQQRVLIPDAAKRQNLEQQVVQVGQAYDKYQTAMRAANKALTLYHFAPTNQPTVTTALQSLYAAGSDLVALANSFMLQNPK